MDRHQFYSEMENPTENKAAEYLKELNKIIETQQELLETQKIRIEELEQQVTELCTENACLKDQHQRHLATCRLTLQQSNSHPTLGAIKENVIQENTSTQILMEDGAKERMMKHADSHGVRYHHGKLH